MSVKVLHNDKGCLDQGIGEVGPRALDELNWRQPQFEPEPVSEPAPRRGAP